MGFFRKISNKVSYSRIGYYFWQIKYRLAFKYIHFLLKINGISAPTGKDVLWHYLLGTLSKEAVNSQTDGIAVKHLYLINNRFIQIRGFTLMSIASGDEVLRKVCDLNAREAHQILGGLIELPILNASNWHEDARQEKKALGKVFHDKSFQFWQEIKYSCESLSTNWKTNKSLPFNVMMQSYSIFGALFFSLTHIPEEIFPLISKFEEIWAYTGKFSANELYENVNAFKELSKDLHAQRKNVTLDPKSDLLHILFESHQSRTIGLNSPESINIAAYLAFFENIPKAMLGLFTMVFSKDKWMTKLIEERERLSKELREQNISEDSNDGFKYILTHSEVFERFYMELLRYWMISPAIPRTNPNLFTNKLCGYDTDMAIGHNVELPPRSLAIVPQFTIARSSKWEKAHKFNPYRSEYKFKQTASGEIFCKEGKPLAQAEPKSVRTCPFIQPTKKYFYAMMWWFPKNNQILITKDERKILKNMLPEHTNFRPITTEAAENISGRLKKRARF